MGYADIAPGHEQVGHVAAVETAIGGPVRCFVFAVACDRDEFVPLTALLERGAWLVKANGPSAGEAGVRENGARAKIVSGQDDVSQKAA